MHAHAVHHLLPDSYDLLGQRNAEIALHQFGNQGVAGLVALRHRRSLVDLRCPVGRVDLAAHPDREGHFAAHETDAAVLERECPVGTHDRSGQLTDEGQQVGRELAADLREHTLRIGLHVVEVEADVLAHVGVGAGDVDLGHAQTDGGAALLLCGPLLVGGRLHRRIVLQRDRQRLLEG